MTHVPKFQTENSNIKLKPLFYGYRILWTLTIAMQAFRVCKIFYWTLSGHVVY